MPRPKKDIARFTLASDLPTESKRTGKPFSSYTTNLYKSKLDKLASEGIQDADAIVANQEKVIKIAKANSVELADADNGEKTAKVSDSKMRIFLSAVFYALSNVPNEKKIALYNEFQNHKEEQYRKFIKGSSLITDEV